MQYDGGISTSAARFCTNKVCSAFAFANRHCNSRLYCILKSCASAIRLSPNFPLLKSMGKPTRNGVLHVLFSLIELPILALDGLLIPLNRPPGDEVKALHGEAALAPPRSGDNPLLE